MTHYSPSPTPNPNYRYRPRSFQHSISLHIAIFPPTSQHRTLSVASQSPYTSVYISTRPDTHLRYNASELSKQRAYFSNDTGSTRHVWKMLLVSLLTALFSVSTLVGTATLAQGTTRVPFFDIPCTPEKLTAYKVILHTFWTRDRFPKHFPEWRPQAQWSKLIGRNQNLLLDVGSKDLYYFTSRVL